MDALDRQVLQQVVRWRRSGRAVAMVTVVRNWGSAPRPPGSLFAVSAEGEFIGSVSGGCIEDDLTQRFASTFPSGVSIARYGIDADEMRRFGLPCGGTLELVVERVHEVASIEAACKAIDARELIERHVDLVTGQVTTQPNRADFELRYTDKKMIQVFGPRWRLLIVGAGAVSEYLAQMAPALGFSVYVNDPREDQRTNWKTGHVQWLDGMPDDAVLAFRPDRRTVVVTLSHDPKVDDMALMEALKTDAFYVGSIGSEASARARRERLLTLDVTQAQLDRLHAPVGLALSSRTPAEIAIAILGDLIQRRNGPGSGALKHCVSPATTSV